MAIVRSLTLGLTALFTLVPIPSTLAFDHRVADIEYHHEPLGDGSRVDFPPPPHRGPPGGGPPSFFDPGVDESDTRDMALDTLFAFYTNPTAPCSGTPVHYHLRNATCYGPIAKGASFNMLDNKEECQAFAFNSQCDPADGLVQLIGLNQCYRPANDKDIYISVQCGFAPVVPDAPPPVRRY